MPGTKESDEIVVAPDGKIMVGAVGATPPADSVEEWDADWTELGYASPDGVTLGVGKTVKDIRGWQSRYPLRRLATEEEVTAAFALLQWNRDTVPFAFGGGEVTEPTAGNYRYDPPEASEIDERALGIEWVDGDKHYRMIFPRGTVTETVESQLVRDDAGMLPITFAALGEEGESTFYLLTDDPAFEPVAS